MKEYICVCEIDLKDIFTFQQPKLSSFASWLNDGSSQNIVFHEELLSIPDFPFCFQLMY